MRDGSLALVDGELRPFVLEGDAHDRALVDATHPPDWRNPTPARRYDLVVVGGGTAGLVAAAGAAGLGAKVALVERRLLGGDCLNFGCVPSKALIRSARAAAELRRAASFGLVQNEVEVDGKAVMERIRRLRASIAPHDSAARLRDLGVDVFLGAARFDSPAAVAVEGARLSFAKACIATGASPAVPPIPGLAESRCLTNETLFTLRELPRRLGILGGGPIGCEMAQAFARLGTEVHVVAAAPRVLGREHEEAAQRVQRALERDGVELHLATKLARVETSGSGRRLHLEAQRAALPSPLEVDELLVAVGRAPNVEGLGLEAAGIHFDRKRGVEVDDFLRTTNPHVFAAGDVATRFKFTHVTDALSRIVLRNALFFGRARASALNVPWCTYTDPEVAHTGWTAEDARDRGLSVEVLRVELSDVDRAVLDGDEEGFLEVRLKKGGDRILGATLVARHAGEQISELSAWMAAGKGLKGLSGVIHPYPTQAEAFKQAGDAMLRTSLKPWIRQLSRRFLSWRRRIGGARD